MQRARTRMFLTLAWCGIGLLSAAPVLAAELKPADVDNAKGDGPDGKGNSADDTWQFWFELAHASSTYHPLSTHTSAMPAQQRKEGIKRKVRGPIASMLPNPDETDGWIFHSDWDGRFEGVWSDRKTGTILVHPYVEKTTPGALAITYRVPKTGTYTISGKLTDVTVVDKAPLDGILWRIEQVSGKTVKPLAKGGALGDGQGRPDSADFKTEKVSLNKGDLVRLVIHPNKNWGTDLTRIDSFKIEPE